MPPKKRTTKRKSMDTAIPLGMKLAFSPNLTEKKKKKEIVKEEEEEQIEDEKLGEKDEDNEKYPPELSNNILDSKGFSDGWAPINESNVKIKQYKDSESLVVDFPRVDFNFMAYSPAGVTVSAKPGSSKIFLRCITEEKPVKGNLLESQSLAIFISDLKSLVEEVTLWSRFQIFKFYEKHTKFNKEPPRLVLFSRGLPMVTNLSNGGSAYTLWPHESQTNCSVYEKKQKKSSPSTLYGLVKSTGNSYFYCTVYARAAEFRYDPTCHEIIGQIWIQTHGIVWFNMGQDTEYRAAAVPEASKTTDAELMALANLI